jgi:hypothetical protein
VSAHQLVSGNFSKPNYPKPMLDFYQTKQIHGSVISRLRRHVRARLALEHEKLFGKPAHSQKAYKVTKNSNSMVQQPSLFEEGDA